MNPVVILTRNNLELTRRTIESARWQHIQTFMYCVDNGSSDGTRMWLEEYVDTSILLPGNLGVSHGWNLALNDLFKRYDHALVVNNDVVLPRWFYLELLSYDVPFVTG